MKKVAAYLRTAAKNHLAIADQLYRVNEYALENKHDISAVYDDCGSLGNNLKNRTLNTLLEKAWNGDIDILYIDSVSIISRNPELAYGIIDELLECGVAVMCRQPKMTITRGATAILNDKAPKGIALTRVSATEQIKTRSKK